MFIIKQNFHLINMNQSNLLYLFKNEIYFYLIEININRGMKLSVGQAVPDAFPERRALMPIWDGLPVPSVRWQQLWPEQEETVLREDASAYPHIPFCANHRVFCGFCRNAWKDGYSRVCTDKIIAEPEQEAEIRQGSGKIRAVYFGGGTPRPEIWCA